jgi:ribosomal protein S18 acetylase RimI-like enzyme
VLGTPDALVLVDEEPPRDEAGDQDHDQSTSAQLAMTLTGAVSVRVYDTPPDQRMVPSRRGHVDALVVAEGHRRRGIGRALMDAAADWARQRGAGHLVLTVWAGNSAARAFYRSLGYDLRSEVLDRKL